MTKKDYELIAESIWRSGYMVDKNKIRQEAKESMRRLIANDLAGSFSGDNPRFDKKNFLTACNIGE